MTHISDQEFHEGALSRDKFVVRFDSETTRQSVADAAKAKHMSMNAFLLQAIDEKLSRGVRLDRLLDVVEFKL